MEVTGTSEMLVILCQIRPRYISENKLYLGLFWLLLLLLLLRCGVVGWDIMLQAGRSRIRFPKRSLGFSIDLILPAALWRWGYAPAALYPQEDSWYSFLLEAESTWTKSMHSGVSEAHIHTRIQLYRKTAFPKRKRVNPSESRGHVFSIAVFFGARKLVFF
jgi:hypothetical protein